MHGAGSANIGAAQLLHDAAGMPLERLFVTNSKGLIWKAADGASGSYRNGEQKAFAVSPQPDAPTAELIDVITHVRPTVLIGAVGRAPGCFKKEVIEKLVETAAAGGEGEGGAANRPVIFALSNPMTQAECTSEQAYEWSGGAAIYGSGTKMNSVTTADGRTHHPGQARTSGRRRRRSPPPLPRAHPALVGGLVSRARSAGARAGRPRGAATLGGRRIETARAGRRVSRYMHVTRRLAMSRAASVLCMASPGEQRVHLPGHVVRRGRVRGDNAAGRALSRRRRGRRVVMFRHRFFVQFYIVAFSAVGESEPPPAATVTKHTTDPPPRPRPRRFQNTTDQQPRSRR